MGGIQNIEHFDAMYHLGNKLPPAETSFRNMPPEVVAMWDVLDTQLTKYYTTLSAEVSRALERRDLDTMATIAKLPEGLAYPYWEQVVTILRDVDLGVDTTKLIRFLQLAPEPIIELVLPEIVEKARTQLGAPIGDSSKVTPMTLLVNRFELYVALPESGRLALEDLAYELLTQAVLTVEGLSLVLSDINTLPTKSRRSRLWRQAAFTYLNADDAAPKAYIFVTSRDAHELVRALNPYERHKLLAQVLDQTELEDNLKFGLIRKTEDLKLPEASWNKIADYLERLLAQERARAVSRMCCYLPPKLADRLFNKAREMGVIRDELSFESPLHNSAQDDEVVFKNNESVTVINPAADESSKRYLHVEALRAWSVAYTAKQAWIDAGFNYIPVEPICNISVGNESYGDVLAATTTSLRGQSLETAILGYDASVQRKINQTTDKIIEVLESLGIDHGHPHTGNFVAVPQKTSTGSPDPSRVPKVFVIDFDEATYMPAKNEYIDQMRKARRKFQAEVTRRTSDVRQAHNELNF